MRLLVITGQQPKDRIDRSETQNCHKSICRNRKYQTITMYIVIESLKNGPDDKETNIVGVHRQVKAASVQAWKLYFSEILKNIQHLKERANRLSVKYSILCWDERPEENVLIGTWHINWPSLERGKDKDKQQQTLLLHVKSVLAELNDGKVPNHLWNRYMSYKLEGAQDAPTPNPTPKKQEQKPEKPAGKSAAKQAKFPAPEEALPNAEVPEADVPEEVPEDAAQGPVSSEESEESAY